MRNLFLTGESGGIVSAMQRLCLSDRRFFDNFCIVNSQIDNNFYTTHLNSLKKHQSFKIRKPEIDILDRDLLFSKTMESVWKETQVIIHSAASVGTDLCSESPAMAIKTNVEGTWNVVEICNKYNINLIYFSTTAIFDPTDYSETKLMTEDTKINPQTIYPITKFAGEQIVRRYCKTQFTIIRPVFGFGDFPDDLNSCLTRLIYIAFSKEKNEVEKPYELLLNPLIKKAYTRVENIARSVLEVIMKNYWNETFNVGTSEKYNWFQLQDAIKASIFANYNDGNQKIVDRVDYNLAKKIKFIPEADYCHWHVTDNSKLYKFGIQNFSDENYICTKEGIDMTVYSTIKNSTVKPYWFESKENLVTESN